MSLIPTRPPLGNWGHSPQTPCQKKNLSGLPPSGLKRLNSYNEAHTVDRPAGRPYNPWRAGVGWRR